ncbi:large conductance mechanosensitive channel protein MscL [Amnibacterium flavum]|uniref:Large-conductance mechanosensitive channel n=1 Tax=Amnibacterium flavum TaxID=2173173 RepID=A0A2V1HT32_9MICO|nr:large conductance mechanosensitive channel protein MscL [Amnibacterium flavum]PVZ93477.1 large conductance mechanosensitive channel protein MscL [Amnibacterium flavum]
MRGFREFILRGNVIDLAVAVVIGTAFTAIVTAIVTSIINPLIGAVFNAASLNEALVVTIPTISGGEADLLFGAALAAVLNFVIVAAVVYFAIVLPVNHVTKLAFSRKKKQEDELPANVPPTEAELLTEIRDLLAARADADLALGATGKHAVVEDDPAKNA